MQQDSYRHAVAYSLAAINDQSWQIATQYRHRFISHPQQQQLQQR